MGKHYERHKSTRRVWRALAWKSRVCFRISRATATWARVTAAKTLPANKTAALEYKRLSRRMLGLTSPPSFIKQPDIRPSSLSLALSRLQTCNISG